MTDDISSSQMKRVVAQLFQELEATKKSLASLQSAQDTKHTVLKPGESIKVADEDGNIVASFGDNASGKPLEILDGPVPAQPEAPELEIADGALAVIVDGYDVHGEPAPADLDRVIVHFSREPDFEPYLGTQKGTIPDANGRKSFIVNSGVWYVCVQWKTDSGKLSEPSEIVSIDIDPPVDAEDIQQVLDDAEAMLDEYEAETAGPRAQTLQSNLTQLGTSLEAAEGRITAAEGAIAPLASDVAAAQTAATNAQNTADQAVADALAAANIAEGKGQVIVQISAPSGSRAREENLWVRLPDHKVHVYQDGSWVAATDPDLVSAAQNAADALTAANAAASKADALELALDGPGGLTDRIQNAEDDLENIDTELDQVATNLNTALTGPVDHDRLRVGTGAFDTGFIGELWAGNIRALAAELSSLIVSSANMIPNGDLTQGDQFWNLSNAEIVTDDTPPGYARAIRRNPGAGTVSHNLTFPVQGGKEYLFEMWIKADKPDSVFFWDMRDQNGIHVGHPDGGGQSSIALEPQGHNPNWRPVSSLVVPTEWQRIRTVLRPGPGVTTLRMATAYFNRSAGTERNATVSIGGLRMVPRDGAEVLVDGAVTAEKVTASREMITKLFATEWAYVSEQLVVAGDLIANNIDAITSQLANLTVTERANFSEAFAEEMWAALGVFDELQAAVGWIGGTMLADDSVTTRNIVFTEELVGNIAELLHLVVDQIDANSVWADTAWLTAVETANVRLKSTIGDWETIISGRGMEVISPEGQPSVQLGNFEETGLTLYQHDDVTGESFATASMTDDGAISGTVISANESLLYQGTELSELLDSGEHYPLGVQGDRSFDSVRGPYYQETGVGYLAHLIVPGRRYKITATGSVRDQADGVGVSIRLRVSHTPGEEYGWPTPSVNDPLVGEPFYFGTRSGGWRSFEFTRTWEWPNPENIALKPTRFLLTIAPIDGATQSSATWRSGGQLIIEDMGLSPTTNSGWHDGGSGGGTPPPEPTPTKSRRVTTWTMGWWRTWWQNGVIPPSGIGYREVVQGRTPYFTTAGLLRGMVGFPSMTSTLSGADIEKIEVRVRVIHSHDSKGGRVRLGLHGNTSRPSSFTGYSNLELTNTHFGRGQEKWVTLPSSTHAGFKNGTHRGVVMYTSSTSTTYYVQANPSRFAIRVTYRK